MRPLRCACALLGYRDHPRPPRNRQYNIIMKTGQKLPSAIHDLNKASRFVHRAGDNIVTSNVAQIYTYGTLFDLALQGGGDGRSSFSP
ncbi:unnamed protein product [Arctia plantaginis]|uniref:Uncharacterized protein n=1 Tax=Arctia plantaginis TaxID=874455 RepID=A0A8S0YP74_ARCPL|nr:unnamed protein product [Arctia plantaginis]